MYEKMEGYWADWTKTLENAMYCIRTDNQHWTVEDFIESGKVDYDKYLNIEDELKEKTAILEIGCGIGRILFNLYDKYDVVYGVDIDKGMIGHAEQLQSTDDKYDNMKFIHLEDNIPKIPLPDKTISYIYSIICFQHIPYKEVQLKYIEEIDRLLSPGGMAKLMIQHDDYAKSDPDCGVGCGLTTDEISGILKHSKIERIEKGNWMCQPDRNYWVILKKTNDNTKILK